jgi:hypothetical protein
MDSSKEKLITEIILSQSKLRDIMMRIKEIRKQCDGLEEENNMLVKYRDNVAAHAKK